MTSPLYALYFIEVVARCRDWRAPASGQPTDPPKAWQEYKSQARAVKRGQPEAGWPCQADFAEINCARARCVVAFAPAHRGLQIVNRARLPPSDASRPLSHLCAGKPSFDSISFARCCSVANGTSSAGPENASATRLPSCTSGSAITRLSNAVFKCFMLRTKLGWSPNRLIVTTPALARHARTER